MKPRVLTAAAAVLMLPCLHAEPLTDVERGELLEKLEELRNAADSRVDARFRAALAAYQAALASDEATRELLFNCIEKVNFKDQQRKSSDFRDWKRNQAENLSSPGFIKAHRLQLRWLMLTLLAASDTTGRDRLAAGAQDVIDAIVRDAGDLGIHQQVLHQAATSSFFARAYEIGPLELENWPLSPCPIEAVYEQVLLPPLRAARRADELRAAWIRRIQQEMTLQENAPDDQAAQGNRRIGMASAMRPQTYDRFIADTLPELQWNMEVDVFRHGDERGAAARMLAHIEKNISHASARRWGGEFAKLMNPEQSAETPP